MTSLSVPRFRLALAALFCGVLALTLLLLHAIAHADPDPLGTAQASVNGGVGLIETYGPVLGSMYLIYQLASALLAKYASSSWFAQGKRLAIATGVLGIIGAALQAQVAGSPWTVIAMAAIAAVFKLITPTVTPAPQMGSAVKAGTIGALLLVVGIGAGVAAPGCATARARGAAAAGAFIDCEAPEVAAVLPDLLPLARDAVMLAISGDGHVDTTRLRADAAGMRSDLGKCALAAAIAALATSPAATPGAAAAAPLTIDGLELRARFAMIRGELGWPAVQLAGGAVL
jgi:hypothetical protein